METHIYDDGTAIDHSDRVRGRDVHKEVVPDAYAEHVRALHERDDVEKMATLVLPEKHMTAVALLITDCLDDQVKGGTPLTASQQRTWDSIVRSMVKAIREAE